MDMGKSALRMASVAISSAIYLVFAGGGIAAEPRTLTILSAEASSQSGQPTINITLDDKGALKFGQFTYENVGKRIVIYIDGEAVFEPTISAPILSGQLSLQVPSGAEQLADALSSGQSVLAIGLPDNKGEVLDSMPLILGGASSNAPSSFGPFKDATITRIGVGAFTVQDASHAGTITVSEAEPCAFDMVVTMDGDALGTYRIDANLLTEIVYTQPTMGAISAMIVGEEGALAFVGPDGEVHPSPPTFPITTGADIEDLQTAATSLKEACPSN